MPIVDRGRIAAALPGQALGRELGSGAFGLVLAARQHDLHRDVAVKVIDLGAAGPSPALRAEASGAHPLTGLDHPHLNRTYAVVAVERLLLVVAELVPGGSLERQNLSPQAACAVALGIADGLAHAHAVGILHRDLKPANILFTAEGQPKLTDLGVVAFAEDSGLTAGRIVGTPQYLAPEQITGEPLGPPTDLYALAATLYELLAGAPLFGAGRAAQDLFRHHCEVEPPAPPGVPAPVADLLRRTLAKRPADRPQSAAEFAISLAEAASRGYGPGWLETAGMPLHVSAALRALAVEPARPGGELDPDATFRRPPEATLTPLPGQPQAAAAQPTAAIPALGPDGTAAADQTRFLWPTVAPETAAVGGSAAGQPGDAAATALITPGTTRTSEPPSPAQGSPTRTRRFRSRRTVVPIVVVVVVLAVAAAVVLPRTLGGKGTKAPAQAQATLAPAGPTAPPTVRPAADSAPLPTPTPPTFPGVTIAGPGQAGCAGDGGPAAQAELDHPYGPAMDGFGNLYFADFDNNRVRRISPDGTITTVAGNGQAGYSGDGGPATAAMLNKPVAVAIGPGGTLYIVDTFNMRVRQVSPDGIIQTVAGSGERPWNPDDDGGPATNAALWYPSGIAVDNTGNLFIADNGNDIIRRVGVDGIITTVAGRFGYGSWGDGKPATQAMISKPFNVALDRQGRIYIADSYNQRIRRIGLDGVIETIAGTGVAGYSGDGGKATAATLREPRGVSVDAAGNVYITDTGNNRVRRIDTTGIITTVAGTAPPGSKSTDTSATALRPDGPVAVDNAGHLYVASRAQDRIVRIDLSG
ncbi:protein kinase [Frankia sp. AgB1.9]|uniref:NHL domain-containing protein n=1 Tax=Frankia sp. AgB1.9 TaxID=1836968 RepID=UPI0019321BBC|nr:protein kinase [Frankia sp. AgB1.9]MBL7550807.1 protein kinase [Frankia sp. AgB1.9]